MKMSERQLCTFQLDDLYLGVEVEQIQEVIGPQDMTPIPTAADSVAGLINLRGQIVTALDLRRLLNLPPAVPEQAINIVIRDADSAISLLVDRIKGVVQYNPEGVEKTPETMERGARDLLRGVCKAKDRLLYMLDTEKVIQRVVDMET